MLTGFARLKSANDPPPGRWGHSFTALEDRAVVIGGIANGNGMYNDVHVFDINCCEWHQPKLSGEGPSPRWGHSAVAIGPDHIMMLGGREGSKPMSMAECFVLDLERNRWQQYPLGTTAAAHPKNRYTHATLMLPNKKFLVVSGHGGRSRYYNDCHLLDLTAVMTRLEGGEPIGVPAGGEPRAGAGAPGSDAPPGSGGEDALAQLGVWSVPTVAGTIPPKRSGATLRAIKENQAILFGGFNGKQILNDLHTLDLRTFMWTKLILFGGSQSSESLNGAVVVVDLETKVTNRMKLPHTPQPRFWHRCAVMRGVMLMFGGAGTRGQARNDMYVLQLSSKGATADTWVNMGTTVFEDEPSYTAHATAPSMAVGMGGVGRLTSASTSSLPSSRRGGTRRRPREYPSHEEPRSSMLERLDITPLAREPVAPVMYAPGAPWLPAPVMYVCPPGHHPGVPLTYPSPAGYYATTQPGYAGYAQPPLPPMPPGTVPAAGWPVPWTAEPSHMRPVADPGTTQVAAYPGLFGGHPAGVGQSMAGSTPVWGGGHAHAASAPVSAAPPVVFVSAAPPVVSAALPAHLAPAHARFQVPAPAAAVSAAGVGSPAVAPPAVAPPAVPRSGADSTPAIDVAATLAVLGLAEAPAAGPGATPARPPAVPMVTTPPAVGVPPLAAAAPGGLLPPPAGTAGEPLIQYLEHLHSHMSAVISHLKQPAPQ